jgi:peroxiredoxin Q/BCP
MPESPFPAIGSLAPDFTAPATGGQTITLSQYRGTRRVILSFYPRDFSWGCTRQLCSYRDHYAELGRRNAVIIGVSPNTPDSQQKFSNRHHFPFPLVSDREGRIARRYGVARRLGSSLRRVTFVIDDAGIIRGIIRHELAMRQHLTEALGVLDRLETQ